MLRIAYLASLIALSATAPASAVTAIYYQNLDGFTADAATPISTFSPSITCGDGQSSCFVGENPSTPPPGYFTLTTAPGSNINYNTANYYAPTDYPSNFITQSYAPNESNYVDIVFNNMPGVRGFGVDVGTYQGKAVQFDLSNGYSFTDGSPAGFGQVKFIGFLTDEDLTGVRISIPDLGDDYTITKFYVSYDGETFNVEQPVPEPAEGAMLVAGLGIAGLVARRRRSA